MSARSNTVTLSEALKVFPAEERSSILRTITEDVVAQQSLPPQPAYSRAYHNGNRDVKQAELIGIGAPPSTLGALENLGLSTVGVTASTSTSTSASNSVRHFDDTSIMLTNMILAAAHKARVKVADQIHGKVSIKELGPDSDLSDPFLHYERLLSLVKARKLDAAYRVPVAKNLKRRLLDEGAVFSQKTKGQQLFDTNRFPAAAKLMNGDLYDRIEADWNRARGVSTAKPSAAPAAAPTDVDLDQILADSLMDLD